MKTVYDLKKIHYECGWHEEAIKVSKLCGCFGCRRIFLSSEIEEWIDESKDCPRGPGRTAVCPKCGIDTVLPESKQYEITAELLCAMNKEWCQ